MGFRTLKEMFAALRGEPTEAELEEARKVTEQVGMYVESEEQKKRFLAKYQWLPQGGMQVGKELDIANFYGDVHDVLANHGWMPPKPPEGVFALNMPRIDYMALFVETGDFSPVLGTVNTFYVSKRWAHFIGLMRRAFPHDNSCQIDIAAPMAVQRILIKTEEPMALQGFPAETHQFKFDIGQPWGTGHKLTNMAGSAHITWGIVGHEHERKRNNTTQKKRIERG